MTSPDGSRDDGAGRIVVALDGSAASIRALRQGARMAEALGLLLRVVTVWHQSHLYAGHLGGSLVTDADATTAVIEAMQDRAAVAVFGAAPPPGFERMVIEGPTIATLLSSSGRAEMLVVGSRGRGGFAGLLLGSVSEACVARASCPVLVCRSEEVTGNRPVHEDARPEAASRLDSTRRTQRQVALAHCDHAGSSQGEIVVGVDGTRASLGALRQGAKFAESMHLPLLAICAYGGRIGTASDAAVVLSDASQLAFSGSPPPWFRSSVRDGAPAAVLGEASEHARMLIIGHSGPSVPTGSPASVSSGIALQATCPVVIFHARHARDAGSFDGSIA